MGARAGRGDRPAPASHPPGHIKTEHTTVLSFPSKGGEGHVCVRSGTLTSPHPWPPVSSDTSQFLPPLHSVGQLQPSLNPCYIYGAPTVCQAPLASRTPPRAEGRLGPEARGRKRHRESCEGFGAKPRRRRARASVGVGKQSPKITHLPRGVPPPHILGLSPVTGHTPAPRSLGPQLSEGRELPVPVGERWGHPLLRVPAAWHCTRIQ